MTFFTASFGTITLRFYLMMGIIIGSFMSGVPILAILALPVFLSALTGASINTKRKENIATLNVVNTIDEKMNTAA